MAKKVAEEKSKLKAIGTFNGLKTKGNFEILLTILFPEEQLANSLVFTAGIGKQFTLEATPEDEGKPIGLGTFTIGSIKIDKNGQAKITFKSDKDQAVQSNIPKLMEEETSYIFTTNL